MRWSEDRNGWAYPVFDLTGTQVARRWKAFDSAAKPKYLWLDGSKAPYYHVGAGLRSAIADAGGLLYIVNGEPAVLTLHAAKRFNVLAFFGESNAPDSLIADLRALDVQAVRYYPDNDPAGERAAAKLRDALQSSGIAFDCLTLPEELPAKADLNDLWQLRGFDASAFLTALDNAPVYDLPAPPPVPEPRQRETAAPVSGETVDWEAERAYWWTQVILPALDSAAPVLRGRGKYQYRRCPNPGHDDNSPSFRISSDKAVDGLPICTCGVQDERDPRGVVAAWIGAPDFLMWWKTERQPLYLPTCFPSQKLSNTLSASEFPTPTADQVQNQRYIDLPTGSEVIALQSDVGTGKTKALIRAAQAASGALYLAPRERLAENFSAEAAKLGVAVENYKQLSKADRRRPARSAFCVNSYSALADEAPGLPVPQLLELDEIEQLIEHIYGEAGTFDDREAIDAAEALKYVIRRSGRILAMDAHLSDLALDYLRAQGRDVLHIVNQYVTERGVLTLHDKREGALAQGEALVNAREGVIVYAVASASRAETISAALVDRLGNAAEVLLLTAENGGGERQSAFFADPNGQIGQYRAVIYSPVIGTGFDITAPVRAVIGIMAAHLSAYDARQMIGRCRHTRETHVYLPKTSGTLEENAATLEAAELEKAERTLKKLSRDGVRVTLAIDDAQRDYLRWHARVMARRNGSINHLRGHFLSLCKGYRITYSAAQAPELKAKLEAIKTALDAARKALVLTVDPIDAETFRRLRDAGKADEKALAGSLRGKIEAVIGVTLSPQLRDQLWSSEQRAQVRRFTDLIEQIAELKQADAHEQLAGIPLPKRRHRTMRRNVVNAFLRALIDDTGVLLQLSKPEFEHALAPVIEKYQRDLKLYFGWRPDRCKTAAATARRVFETVGLKLASDQRTSGGEHVRFYQIEAATFEQIRTLAAQRLALLERQRAEINGAPVNLKSAMGALSKGDGSFKIAQSPPQATAIRPPRGGAAPQEFAPRIAARMEPLGQGG